jgi:hypothetical protein
MNTQLFVGTRKGLVTFERGDAGWAVQATEFLAQPVPMLLPAEGSSPMYVAVDHGHFGNKLHRRTEDGTWDEVAVPSYPKVGDEAGDSLELLWILEHDGRGGLWAGTISGGLFHASDAGETWQLNTALWDQPSRSQWFGGGYDKPGIHSVCVHRNDADDVLVGISCGGAWRTRDGGKTWSIASVGMFADYSGYHGN